MLTQYMSYKDKIADKLAVYENKTLEELKEIIKDYPDYTSEDMLKLEKLRVEDRKALTPKEAEISSLKIDLEQFKRSRDVNRDNACDDLFPEHDKAHAIRAIACDLIISYIEEKLS